MHNAAAHADGATSSWASRPSRPTSATLLTKLDLWGRIQAVIFACQSGLTRIGRLHAPPDWAAPLLIDRRILKCVAVRDHGRDPAVDLRPLVDLELSKYRRGVLFHR